MMDKNKMDPVIDLIWSVEEEITPMDQSNLNPNCGGTTGCAACCCCTVPNVLTKFVCN